MRTHELFHVGETMTELDYAQLQVHYSGQFVAHRQGQVLAHAPTYEDLQRQLEALNLRDPEIIIEYIERSDCVYVYEGEGRGSSAGRGGFVPPRSSLYNWDKTR